jgi:Zn-dependent protease
MQQNGLRIGSLFGIPFYVDSSWFLVFFFYTYLNAMNFLPRFGSISWVAGGVLALLLFASVLLHELGHSLVALSQGIRVNSITLFLFGGVAAIDRESKTPLGAFMVAIAGPLVSVVLFALFAVGAGYLPEGVLLQVIAIDLSRINLVLAIFNMIPGLPLDGGQVLKAFVWQITGSRNQGIRWAANSGKFLGSLGIALGLVLFLSSGRVGWIWLGLIGFFIYRNADSYDRITTLQQTIRSITAADAMTREFRVVDAQMSLREFAETYILKDLQQQLIPYYAASDGRYRGLVLVSDLQNIERSQWDHKTLMDIAHPLDTIATRPEKTDLADLINFMEDQQLDFVTILSPAGAVAGVVDRGDIIRVIASKMNIPIRDQDIHRIKSERAYPPDFQLVAIVKSMQNQ